MRKHMFDFEYYTTWKQTKIHSSCRTHVVLTHIVFALHQLTIESNGNLLIHREAPIHNSPFQFEDEYFKIFEPLIFWNGFKLSMIATSILFANELYCNPSN